MATCPPEAAEHDRLSVPHIRTFRFRFTRIISRYGMTVEIASDTPLWKRVAAEDALSWKPWPFENPSLLGHCSIAFSGGRVVHRIPVFRKAEGSMSIGTPDAADVDRDGQIRKKPDGKASYHRIISFETTAAHERWQRMIQTAIAEAGVSEGAS